MTLPGVRWVSFWVVDGPSIEVLGAVIRRFRQAPIVLIFAAERTVLELDDNALSVLEELRANLTD